MLRTALVLLLASAAVWAGPYSIELQGSGQHGRIGSTLDEPISVVVRDSLTGEPLEGVGVVMRVRPGNGVLLPLEGSESVSLEQEPSGEIHRLLVYTDEEGVARSGLMLSESMGDTDVELEIRLPGEEERYMEAACLAVDLRSIIFQLLGGLAVFLLGMKMMSDSLQRVAGDKMRVVLRKLTDNRVMGIAAGALVTAAIQSSSATSVITLSFVNSGLMALRQAVGVIIGANIGTTITGQLIAFKITSYAYPMVAIGFAFMAFSKNRRRQFWGRVLLGLGLVFLGMTIMKQVMTPLRTSVAVRTFFTTFSDNPLLAVLAGTLVTMAVQSSSATVGLTMTLAGSGLISLQGAVFLVLGDNIGTTVTAQLAAIGSGRSAKQTAMAHTLFNVIGALYFGLAVANFGGLLEFFRGTSSDPMRQVANAHSIFNIFNAIIFIPFVPALTRISRWVIPAGRQKPRETAFSLELDENILDSPAIAMDEISRHTLEMARTAGEAVREALAIFLDRKGDPARVMELEDRVDLMQRDLTVYASKLFQRDLGTEASLKLPVMLHSINDLERVSDYAVNIVEAAGRKGEAEISDIGELFSIATRTGRHLRRMLDLTEELLEKGQRRTAEAIMSVEASLDRLEEEARSFYSQAICSTGHGDLTGLAVLDYVDNCERVGDHLTNVAQSHLGGNVWHGDEEDV
ncbi:MAG: Na/Pi cotransporter family protein [Candidatus Fermentibacteraceae bacterium]